MKGRTPESLLRSVAEWHESLGHRGAAPLLHWEPAGIVPFRLEEG